MELLLVFDIPATSLQTPSLCLSPRITSSNVGDGGCWAPRGRMVGRAGGSWVAPAVSTGAAFVMCLSRPQSSVLGSARPPPWRWVIADAALPRWCYPCPSPGPLPACEGWGPGHPGGSPPLTPEPGVCQESPSEDRRGTLALRAQRMPECALRRQSGAGTPEPGPGTRWRPVWEPGSGAFSLGGRATVLTWALLSFPSALRSGTMLEGPSGLRAHGEGKHFQVCSTPSGGWGQTQSSQG